MDAPAHSPDKQARFTLIRLDLVELLVPQADLLTLESILDLEENGGQGGALGVIAFRRERVPVYCPTDALEPSPTLIPGRRICCVLATAEQVFAIACREVTSIVAAAAKLVELPSCMHSNHTAVRALGLLGGRIVSVTDAARLVETLSVRQSGPSRKSRRRRPLAAHAA